MNRPRGSAGMRSVGASPLPRRAGLSAFVVIFAGSLLHFAWEWSGRSTVVAVFAATNESTWEHLKMAFWPALALVPVQRAIYGPQAGWLPAAAIRCILPSLLIVGLFYGYIALTGTHHLAADILIFGLAVGVGEFLGHATLTRRPGRGLRAVSLVSLVVATVLFATLTFWPPALFLFDEPHLAQPPAGGT